ncbi:MAG: efflux RND transporter periplasmic adaptor subunit [Deltaproteobacteria bacterium]|nr:efflux RND transporter periplasmic adaptor subunit [Deltaproteobacteria bacterium]
MRSIGLSCFALGIFGALTITTVGVVMLPLVVSAQEQETVVYTCSMHPQVRLPNPGKCPICDMPLIPAVSSSSPGNGNEVGMGSSKIELSEYARSMASVESVELKPMELSHDVYAVGKVSYNETALSTITARVDGYVERLFVNFTGIDVNKGDHLVEIYSPDLVVAQQEVLIAVRSGDRGSLLDSTLLKLSRWGLSEWQLKSLVESRKVTERVTLFSPISGTVISRNITQSGAFRAGDALYQIANLDTVWVYLDVYESQLPWLRYGQKVELITESLPNRKFAGMVTFVSPLVDEESRTIKVPVHIENPDHALKPGMFMSGRILATLSSSGQPAATGIEGKFTCPMHPQVLEDGAGSCPICGMDLKEIPGKSSLVGESILAVPASAVIDSGLRQFVYVEQKRGVFKGVEVKLGPRAGNYFPVLSGLNSGERVVVRGNFLLDSQAQISGQPSLFYPRGAAYQDAVNASPSDGKSRGQAAQTPHIH